MVVCLSSICRCRCLLFLVIWICLIRLLLFRECVSVVVVVFWGRLRINCGGLINRKFWISVGFIGVCNFSFRVVLFVWGWRWMVSRWFFVKVVWFVSRVSRNRIIFMVIFWDGLGGDVCCVGKFVLGFCV